MNNEIHIGALIRSRMESEGRSVSWLAEQLNCSRVNIYKIYERPNIDTAMLNRICLVLDFDFFKYYSDSVHASKKSRAV
jgi:DNA-binding Xre family transcriptional regulator